MKSYTIGGQQFSQGRLTVSALLRLVRLVKGRASGVALDLESVLALLEDAALLREFLDCVLTGPVADIDLGALEAESLVEVVGDFLSLNGQLLPKLLELVTGITSQIQGLPATASRS